MLNRPLVATDPDGHFPWLLIPVLAVAAAVLTSDSPQIGPCPQHHCGPLIRYQLTVDYMHTEMIQNAQSVIAAGIQETHGVADVFRIGGETRDLAEMIWGFWVMPGSYWDHKPDLTRMLGLDQDGGDFYYPIEGDSEHEYYYDIWSNIHFGFVGAAAEFDLETLQAGASVRGIAGANDAYDALSIQIGFELWHQYGLELTHDQIRDAILAYRDEYLAIWRDVYNSDHRILPPIIESTNGN